MMFECKGAGAEMQAAYRFFEQPEVTLRLMQKSILVQHSLPMYIDDAFFAANKLGKVGLSYIEKLQREFVV
ncbi:MAG: hypothetical protein A3J24_09250 [Deltaproteobacteria bacterium RIFCSPLOWO2_02_FULL_53_8]|nr:MAG: hypothetical protein A3J24_09250 [Deltaproteobacteria bacterium RIFCSPLOWO2_02_FULL_53_8]